MSKHNNLPIVTEFLEVIKCFMSKNLCYMDSFFLYNIKGSPANDKGKVRGASHCDNRLIRHLDLLTRNDD